MKRKSLPIMLLLGTLALGTATVLTSCGPETEEPPAEEPEVKTGTVSLESNGDFTGGSISLSKTGEVEVGTVITVTVTPDEGYELDALKVNGSAISGTTFKVVEGANVVSATFKLIPIPEEPEPTYPAFNKGLEENARTRDFDSDYDLMLDDFSGETANGTFTGLTKTDSYLTVPIDYLDEAHYPNNDGQAIYKLARSSEDIHSYNDIIFRMRVKEGSLPLSNLVLGLRGGDAFQVYGVNMADGVDSDGEPTSEIGTEWTDVKISLLQTLLGDEVYNNTDGTPSTTAVLDKILGLHLYVTGEVQAVLEIQSVKGDDVVFEDFNHEATNAPGDGLYWRDSTGYITTKSLIGKGSYTIASEEFANYEDIALRMLGDVPSDYSITANYSDETTKNVAKADLKDDNNVSLVEMSNGAYGSYVINFSNSGIDNSKLESLTVNFNSNVSLNQVFLTSMEEDVAVTTYPKLDLENKTLLSDFNFLYEKPFTSDYEASNTDPTMIEEGLNYMLSYGQNGNKVKVDGNNLVFDATALDAADYIDIKIGKSEVFKGGDQYLVMSVKLEDGATLDNFRIDDGKGAVYANQMVSDTGLPITMGNDETYPYIDANGYTYLVVDINKSGLENLREWADEGIQIYYSGTGKLLIDEIFFTDRLVDYGSNFVEDKIMDLSTYQYVGGVDLNTTTPERYLKMTVTTEDENVTLKSFRIEVSGAQYWFKDSVLRDANGNVISGDTPITGSLTVVVDLVGSGIEPSGTLHVHAGGAEGATGNVKVQAMVGNETTKSYQEILA